MRKLDLSSYKVKDSGTPEAEEHDYDSRWSIGEVLLARDLGLTARELLANDDLYRKIRDWPEETILLEEAEHAQLEQAFQRITGYGRHDVELVRRVLDAAQVAVQEKPGLNPAEGPPSTSGSQGSEERR